MWKTGMKAIVRAHNVVGKEMMKLAAIVSHCCAVFDGSRSDPIMESIAQYTAVEYCALNDSEERYCHRR